MESGGDSLEFQLREGLAGAPHLSVVQAPAALVLVAAH
jgi:hypothetical protein